MAKKNQGTEETQGEGDERQRIGADLIFPLAGVAFAIYYVWSIQGMPWMAQFNGIFLSSVLGVLLVVFAARALGAFVSGRARFSFADLVETPDVTLKRWGVFALAIAFTYMISWIGFTLAVFLFLLIAMVLLQVRPWAKLLGIAIAMSVVGYLLFIVGLDARLPHGPVENFLGRLY